MTMSPEKDRYLGLSAAAGLLRNSINLIKPRQTLLILSHMRSYSTLLSHLLGSHPEITGYAEMHQSYRNSLDVLRLRVKVLMANDYELKGRYVLDKVLHNERVISDAILNSPATAVIFLVREPQGSLRSIFKMGKKVPDMAWVSQPEALLEYYCQRLAELEVLSRRRRTPAYFLNGDLLLTHSKETLQSVSTYLGLHTPLSESYQIFRHTGESGYGDFSETVRSGHIIREEKKDDVHFEPQILAEAWDAYERCVNTLNKYCEVTPVTQDVSPVEVPAELSKKVLEI
jgi:hypothetical protein